MADKGELTAAITGQVRLAFHRLRAVGDRLHRDVGVTSAMRGVMETLAEVGPQTVPQMARARPVARQHIQVIVDALGAQGLVVLRDNPAHRRSPFVALSAKGQRQFDLMRRREASILPVLARDIAKADLLVTMRTMGALIDHLSALVRAMSDDKDVAPDEGGS